MFNRMSIVVAIALITVSAMAAMVVEKPKTTSTCKDTRIAMDGSVDAVVEKAGLSSRTSITFYKLHNYKRFRFETVDVQVQPGPTSNTYVGNNLKMVVYKKNNPKTGRQPASLQAIIKGERLSVAMGCKE